MSVEDCEAGNCDPDNGNHTARDSEGDYSIIDNELATENAEFNKYIHDLQVDTVPYDAALSEELNLRKQAATAR